MDLRLKVNPTNSPEVTWIYTLAHIFVKKATQQQKTWKEEGKFLSFFLENYSIVIVTKCFVTSITTYSNLVS